MQEPEDEDILNRFAIEATRQVAFEELVRRHQERLYWHIRRLVIVHDDADDILQNVFIKVWRALPDFRREASLFTWMYRIATNECLTFLKQKNRKRLFSFEELKQEPESQADDPLFTGDMVQRKLQKAMERLPPQQRLVFTLKYLEGKKYEEISTLLGLSVGGLKAHYHLAVKKIEKYLSSH